MGTVHGSYTVSAATLSGQPNHYHGTLHIMGGTKHFQHVTGTLQITCTDDIPNESCHGSGPVSGT